MIPHSRACAELWTAQDLIPSHDAWCYRYGPPACEGIVGDSGLAERTRLTPSLLPNRQVQFEGQPLTTAQLRLLLGREVGRGAYGVGLVTQALQRLGLLTADRRLTPRGRRVHAHFAGLPECGYKGCDMPGVSTCVECEGAYCPRHRSTHRRSCGVPRRNYTWRPSSPKQANKSTPEASITVG